MFKNQKILVLLLLLTTSTGCYRASKQIEPRVIAPLHPKEVQMEKRCALFLPEDFSVSPFPALTCAESREDWGKEHIIALAFARDFDLYRAITAFKRALYLLPMECISRRQEIEYEIALAYFLGKKYIEVVYAVESTSLAQADASFCAFPDLLLILYESYGQIGKKVCADHILSIIEGTDPDQGKRLLILEAVQAADFATLFKTAEEDLCRAYIQRLLCAYQREAKSVRKAEFLNIVLPGAGYWYVGMKQTAITALVVNSLFIAAGVHFIDHGSIAAGIITLSLEAGWYFGGIYGAGLAAKYYNEKMYCCYADKISQKEQYYPLLMLQYTF